MEAARVELAFRRINTVSLPINLRIHMVVGFRLNLPEPPLICFYRRAIDWLVIQTMVNKP